MKTTVSRRLPVALLLLCAVAMNVLLAGLQHGQATALGMSGLDGGFCSLGTIHAGASDTLSDYPPGASGLHCVSCLAAGGLPVTGWPVMTSAAPGEPLDAHRIASSPFSDRWPSANPRASPGLS